MDPYLGQLLLDELRHIRRSLRTIVRYMDDLKTIVQRYGLLALLWVVATYLNLTADEKARILGMILGQLKSG